MYLVQGKLLSASENTTVALYHNLCGALFERDEEWLVAHEGARLPCPGCARPDKIPPVRGVGSEA